MVDELAENYKWLPAVKPVWGNVAARAPTPPEVLLVRCARMGLSKQRKWARQLCRGRAATGGARGGKLRLGTARPAWGFSVRRPASH